MIVTVHIGSSSSSGSGRLTKDLPLLMSPNSGINCETDRAREDSAEDPEEEDPRDLSDAKPTVVYTTLCAVAEPLLCWYLVACFEIETATTDSG
jgi:hypothetical protein